MVYRFTIISDEVDDFIREIQIDSEATFFELHEAILKAAKYNDDQMTSFFTCDDDWEKEQEITLEDMGTSSDEDCYIMRETRLSELLEDEKQRMLYVFDPLAERVFFIELSEIIYGKDIEKICLFAVVPSARFRDVSPSVKSSLCDEEPFVTRQASCRAPPSFEGRLSVK